MVSRSIKTGGRTGRRGVTNRPGAKRTWERVYSEIDATQRKQQVIEGRFMHRFGNKGFGSILRRGIPNEQIKMLSKIDPALEKQYRANRKTIGKLSSELHSLQPLQQGLF